MQNKEEILNKLLKNLLDNKIKRLEKRNLEQMKDLKLEKESYKKQGLLLKKLCSVKIEPKKSLKKNMTTERLPRGRDKTPNYSRTRRKNSLNNIDNKKFNRSKTPNVIMRKKKVEPSKEKTKIDNIKKSKTPLKTTKRTQNDKIPSYMAATSSNMNKNKKFNNKSSFPPKKAKTPDAKSKNTNKKKEIKLNKNIMEANLKLIDLKVEDMKEYIIDELNPQFIEEPKKEEIKECKFKPLIENEKIINTLSFFLDEYSQYNLFSCNKQLSKYLYQKLRISYDKLNKDDKNSNNQTIQDQINSLKEKYTNEQLNAEPPKFELTRSTIKAIELLNEDKYNDIFRKKELNPPLNEILLIYRLYFQLLNVNNICDIKDDKLFWLEASDYILKNSNGKTGDFLKQSINSFNFSAKNIFEVKKLFNGNEDKLKPTLYSKICGTTSLIIFLLKDTFEYLGIIRHSKKSVPSILLKYLEYIEEKQNKLGSYINNLKNLSENL